MVTTVKRAIDVLKAFAVEEPTRPGRVVLPSEARRDELEEVSDEQPEYDVDLSDL